MLYFAHQQLGEVVERLNPHERIVQREGQLIRTPQAILELREWQGELHDLSVKIVGLGTDPSEQEIKRVLDDRRDELRDEIMHTPDGVINHSPIAVGGRQRKKSLQERMAFLRYITMEQED